MKPFSSHTRAHARRTHIAAALAFGGLLWLPGAGVAQTTGAASAPHAHPQAAGQATATSADPELQKQLAELQAQVAKLQAALDQQQKQTPQTPTAGAPASPAPAPGRRMMGEMGAMPPGGMRMSEMGGMGSGGMGAGQPGGMSGGMEKMDMMQMMDMHKGEMGMPPDGMKMPDNMMSEMGMGSMSSGSTTPSTGGMTMGGGGAAATPSASSGMGGMNMGGSSTSPAGRTPRASRSMSSLPGVPGASHVYHIGSTGFFLDQPQLNLTTQQQTALNRIKERALLERGNAERRIEQAEQEVWTLTGADQPDAAKVQAKLQEIEQLRTNQRIGFIRAVGEATKQLTPEQQSALLGTAPPTK